MTTRNLPPYVPMQDSMYVEHEDQQTLVQHTTVIINSAPPKDHIIWSLLCFVYSNPCCLGLAALIYSIKARDRKVVGDLEGARHYGATARQFNIVSTVLVTLGLLAMIITLIALYAFR